MNVVVIGAGIAGLGAARVLCDAGIDVTILERADEVGGRCRSLQWHHRWHHTGAEALMSSEDALSGLRQYLASRGAAPSSDLQQWETVHGERIYIDGAAVNPLSLAGLRAMPGGIVEKARLAALVPKILRQRRHHDVNDMSSAAWADHVDGAQWLRSRAPRTFDTVIEPFMQYSTLQSGEYGLAWVLFSLADLGWARRGWWTYDVRGAGGVTYELGRVLQQRCQVRLGSRVTSIRRTGSGFGVEYTVGESDQHLDADGVVLAVPGHVAARLADGILGPAHQPFLSRIRYGAHHFARYLVTGLGGGLPHKLLLPSAAGFRCVGKVTVSDNGPDEAFVTVDIKDPFASSVDDATQEHALDAAWAEAQLALPGLRSAQVSDRVLTRNDTALCRRPTGFVRDLAAFRSLPAVPGFALAGDYMFNSTVGSALKTGEDAAAAILARAGHSLGVER